MTPIVQYDERARYVTYPTAKPVETQGDLAPQAHANSFLEHNAELLSLRPETLASLAQPLASMPEDELAGLRLEIEKSVMDTVVVGYAQTYFGLPVIGAGVSVTLVDAPRAIRSASSTVHDQIKVDRPSDAAIKRALSLGSRRADTGLGLGELGLVAPEDGLDETQRETRINTARLVVFQYRREDAPGRSARPRRRSSAARCPRAQRQRKRRRSRSTSRKAPLPSMPLPPLPDSIRDGEFYVALELYFVATTPPWGRLNWVAYIDVETMGILQLKPLVDHVTAGVFLRDPITKGSGLAPSATNVQLNPLRDSVAPLRARRAVRRHPGAHGRVRHGRRRRRPDGGGADRRRAVQLQLRRADEQLRRGEHLLPGRPLLPHWCGTSASTSRPTSTGRRSRCPPTIAASAAT